MFHGEDWRDEASCRDTGDLMFPTLTADQHTSAKLCRSCPVVRDCLAAALDGRLDHGVWGGLTERQRRALRRDHPDVTSWRDRLAAV